MTTELDATMMADEPDLPDTGRGGNVMDALRCTETAVGQPRLDTLLPVTEHDVTECVQTVHKKNGSIQLSGKQRIEHGLKIETTYCHITLNLICSNFCFVFIFIVIHYFI